MADLQQAVKKFSQDLAQKVESFIDDVSTLKVRTYTTSADQIETFVSAQGQSGTATLRSPISAVSTCRCFRSRSMVC